MEVAELLETGLKVALGGLDEALLGDLLTGKLNFFLRWTSFGLLE